MSGFDLEREIQQVTAKLDAVEEELRSLLQTHPSFEKERDFLRQKELQLRDEKKLWLELVLRTRGGSAVGGPGNAAGAAGLEQVLFPSQAYRATFTLYNGGHLAAKLASHAMACGIRGTVRHMSAERSDYVIVVATDGGYQTLRDYFNWVRERVSLLRAEDAVPADTPYVVLSSGLRDLQTSEAEFVTLLWQGGLAVSFASPTLELELSQLAYDKRGPYVPIEPCYRYD